MHIPKFRAWHKEEKRMYIITKIFFSANYVELISNNYMRGAYLNEIELMQWTGYQDKGSLYDLYEGDILDAQDIYQVFFSEASFFVARNKEIKATWWYLNACMSHRKVKVIGNIYQHPELLETKDNK